MKTPPPSGFWLVATRELRWMRRDGVALFLAIGMPLLAFSLLALTFSKAVIRDLPVSIVDADRSAISMTYVQAVSSSPSLLVAERPTDLNGAMHDIRSGQAIAAVYIPADFERDLLGGKRPQIVVFYNRQFFTPGNNAASAITSALASASAALPAPVRSSGYAPGSLVVEQYVLTNPALNFAQFLLRSVLPTVLHVVTAISAGYAVGSEFSRRSVRTWLRAAGGNPLTALLGKLAPLLLIFALMMTVVSAIIHGLFDIPFRGDVIQMGAAAYLLLMSYLAIGALLQLLVRNLAFGLSLTAVVCSPAFGFAGVGFPLLAMNGFSKIWGWFLPLRWYMQILFDQAVRGLPTAASAWPFVILGTIAIVAFALCVFRLQQIAKTGARRSPSAWAPRPILRRGIGASMVEEIRLILNDRAVLAMMMLAPLIYGALYPQPYLGQVLRDIPVAVVDQDGTEVSRELVQTLNADEAIRVTVRAQTAAQAHAALARGEVFAILTIPGGTEREILRGGQARIAAYVDSAYFLVFNRTLQGMREASGAVSAGIAAHGARADGSLARAAMARASPIEIVSAPLFNPTGGYASYVVPAAFVLILQQTLLMGAAMLGGVAFQEGGVAARRRRGTIRAIIGQSLAHLCVALPGLALFMVILPRIYGFSTLGHGLDVIVMAVPFLLASSLMGQFVGGWFRRRETAVLVFVATSLPLFFMVGMAWPVESIPDVLRAFSRIFPSTSAIDGLVRINQMGAPLSDVAKDWATLWVLTGVYAVLAVVTSFATSAEGARHDH
jgi:ABC-2 type transport system permease protein